MGDAETTEQAYAKDLYNIPAGKYKMILSPGGKAIEHNFPDDIDERVLETLAVMCATLYGASKTLNLELKKKVPDKIEVNSLESLITIIPEDKNLKAIFEIK